MTVLMTNASDTGFSLLANAQTLIGVIITLAVLCLFESRSEDKQESSNFIRRISDELWATFSRILEPHIKKLGETLKNNNSSISEDIDTLKEKNPAALPDYYRYLGLEMEASQKFLINSQDKMLLLERERRNINNVDYISQSQRFILIVCVVVMFLDALSFRSPEWISFLDVFCGPFLFTLALLSFLICLLLWNQKFQVIKYKKGESKKVSKLRQRYWLRMPIVMVSILAMTALVFVYSLITKSGLWLIALILIWGLYLYFVKIRLFKILPEERNNSSFPLKHAAYALTVSALVGIASFLLDKFCDTSMIHMVWVENLHTCRNLFVFVMAFCSILWPIYQEYIYFLICTEETKKEIEEDCSKALEERIGYSKKRKDLVKNLVK